MSSSSIFFILWEAGEGKLVCFLIAGLEIRLPTLLLHSVRGPRPQYPHPWKSIIIPALWDCGDNDKPPGSVRSYRVAVLMVVAEHTMTGAHFFYSFVFCSLLG